MTKNYHRSNTNSRKRMVLNATTSFMALAGLLSASSALAATTTAVSDTFSVDFGSTTFLEVLANDTFKTKQDGTPLVTVSMPSYISGFQVVNNKIQFKAPNGTSADPSKTVPFTYTITDVPEGFGDTVSPTNYPTPSSASTTEVGSASVGIPANHTTLQQASVGNKTPWEHIDGKEYLGVSTIPSLMGLPECTGAKYRVTAKFSAQKYSGDSRSKLAVSIGSAGSSMSPLPSSATGVSVATVAWPNTGSVEHTAEYTGALSNLRVGVFVLNELVQSGGVSSASEFQWAPVGLEVKATADTSGCTKTTSTASSTVTVSGDFDGDGMNNDADPDDDNDGIPDTQEGTTTDTDGDGKPDRVDLDSDNDGIPDKMETAADQDGDGKPNNRDLDSDNDGIPDTWEAFHQPNVAQPVGSNQSNDHSRPVFDMDNDGVQDYLDLDSDNDGIQDVMEEGGTDDASDLGEADGTLGQPNALRDRDNDGIPNVWDLDSDNDTIPDIIEGQCFKSSNDATCLNNLSLVSTTTGRYAAPPLSDKGWASAYRSTGSALPDSDGDGLDSYLDWDDDNDGEKDITEAGFKNFDTDNNGIIDSPQNVIQGWSRPSAPRVNSNPNGGSATVGPYPDSDADGIPDFIEILVNEAKQDAPQADKATGANSDKINTGLEGNGGGALGGLGLALLAGFAALARLRRK